MKWNEILESIDSAREAHPEEAERLLALRRELRLVHNGKDLMSDIPENDELANRLIRAVAPYVPAKPEPIDDLAACVPVEEQRAPDKPGSKRVAAASVEGASLVIEPRENPFVPKKPVLEDADEDTVGK